MGLNEKLVSSNTLVTGYAIQPYKPVTDIAAAGNRNPSPMMIAPAVADVAQSTAPAGSRVRGVAATTSTPKGQLIRNGAATQYGNNAPRKGWTQ
jgi:hypothetical protein